MSYIGGPLPGQEETKEEDLSWSDVGKGVATGLNVVGKVYEAGDKAVGIHEPMEAVSDKLAQIPLVGGAASFVWDVTRPDFLDIASFSGGPIAGGGQYLASLPAGVARASAKRIARDPKLLEKSIDGILNNRRLKDYGNWKITDGDIEDVLSMGDDVVFKPGSKEEYIYQTVQGFAAKKGGGGFGVVREAEVPQQIRQALSRIGSRGGVYNHKTHLAYKQGKVISPDESRNIIALFETLPEKYIRGKGGKVLDFPAYSKSQTNAFWRVYGKELSSRGIRRNQIQVHHINSLGASIGLYHGLKWGSKEWYDLTAHLAKKYISAGNDPKNLMRISGDAFKDKGTPHFMAHKFLDKRVGKRGELLFDDDTLDAMEGDWATRIAKADELAEFVKESEAIAVQTQKVWDYLYGVGQVIPEELVDFMSSLPANKDYQIEELRELALRAVMDQKLAPKGKPYQLPTPKELAKIIEEGKVSQTSIFDADPAELNRIMSTDSKVPEAKRRRPYKKKKDNPDQKDIYGK